MILKYISSNDLNFAESFKEGVKKVKKLPFFDKYITIFWLLGPFIYLIERSPADIWLSIIGVIFLCRCIKKKDWAWSKQIWFKLAIAFWVISLVSAIISPDPLLSISQGFVWIRFPLYAAAAQAWIAKDRDIRVMMLISLLYGLITMCVILFLELLFEPKNRLTWPYGDKTPGGYLSKVSMPIFIIMIALVISKSKEKHILSGFIASISIIFSILTGERTHFILRACSGMLASLFWKPSMRKFLILVLIEILAVVAVFILVPQKADRFINKFASSIPILNTNTDYWGSWRGGIQQGLSTPILGIGPTGTRNTCKDLPPHWLPGKNYCGNHPHNFYIQMFAETGIIGLIVGSSMILSIIVTCYKNRKSNIMCPMVQTAFVIPLGMFFPLQQFGSFFGQWGNLFIWISIGFALSQIQNYEKVKK